MISVDINLTTGTVILIVIWIICGLYSIIKKDNYGIDIAFFVSVLYGLYRYLVK